MLRFIQNAHTPIQNKNQLGEFGMSLNEKTKKHCKKKTIWTTQYLYNVKFIGSIIPTRIVFPPKLVGVNKVEVCKKSLDLGKGKTCV